MKKNYSEQEKSKLPLLGLCPIGKFVFSHEDAKRQKVLLEQKLTEWNVPYVNIDEVVEDGIIRGTADIEPAVKFLQAKGIGALFMPHCNFGTEHAVGLIGRELGVPVLIWGPRDEAPLADGTRLRDSLCGMFASTKVLHKMAVPYSYIENCRVDDSLLRDGLDRFLRAANVADIFRNGVRIGHIGQRIDFFWTTIINESELLDKFKIEVLPLDMVEFIGRIRTRLEKDKKKYNEQLADLKKVMDINGFADDQPVLAQLAAAEETAEMIAACKLDAVAFQSFNSICEAFDSYSTYISTAMAEICPVGDESDIHGAVSGLVMDRASLRNEPSYLTEFTVRHPDNDNAVMLWHCGAPLSLCHPECRPKLDTHWILPLPMSGMTHFRLKDGDITVARFDGDHGEYKLALGEGFTVDGPFTQNNYCWFEVNDWPAWERQLMYGPFIHHCAMNYGHYSAVLQEACRYIPGLEPVVLG